MEGKEPEPVNGQPVSVGGDNGCSVPPDAKEHRQEFVEYVINHARPWHREHLGRLYRSWIEWNDRFFGGKLIAPYVFFLVPSWSRAYGDYANVSGFGGIGQTRIRPKLLTGEHRDVREGDEYAAGRQLFVEDVFLHETIHQFCHEVIGDLEVSYKGHGPIFAGECNRIGAMLGLPPVRHAKARGAYKSMPSCAQWPHCVRPDGYYLGAFPVPEDKKPDPDPLEIELERLRQRVAELEAENTDLRKRLEDAVVLAGIGLMELEKENYTEVGECLGNIIELGLDEDVSTDRDNKEQDTEESAEQELVFTAV
jgi:hypothetical protein